MQLGLFAAAGLTAGTVEEESWFGKAARKCRIGTCLISICIDAWEMRWLGLGLAWLGFKPCYGQFFRPVYVLRKRGLDYLLLYRKLVFYRSSSLSCLPPPNIRKQDVAALAYTTQRYKIKQEVSNIFPLTLTL